MAGRHRRPPAWRRVLTALVRSRDDARTAALEAEVVALRATVAELRSELARIQVAAAAAEQARVAAVERAEAFETAAELRWTTLRMPLVKVALGDPADVTSGPEVAAALAGADRSEDTVITEIVLEPTPAPADRLAWSVLANLPERRLLDPKTDRDQQPRDVVAATAPGREERRTA